MGSDFILRLYQSSDEELDPGNVTSTLSDSTTTEKGSEKTSDAGRCFWTELISLLLLILYCTDNTGVAGYITQVPPSVTTEMTIGNACVRWYDFTKPLSLL